MNTKCPRCGSEKDFRPVEVEARDRFGTFFALGFMAFLVQREATGKKLLCENCDFVFSPKKRTNWPDLAAFVFVLVLIFAALLYGFYWAEPAVFKTLFF
jgi:rubredoxin